MKVWISTVGTSPFAIVNPFWAACIMDDFVPERIHLLKNPETEPIAIRAREWISSILSHLNVTPQFHEHSIDEEDLDLFARKLCEVIESEHENQIAIDMTPGRKFMSACALLAGRKYPISKLYYLHLYDAFYRDRPFVLIPFNRQRLVNILEIVGERD